MRTETSEDGGGEKHNQWRCREGQEFEKETFAFGTGKKDCPYKIIYMKRFKSEIVEALS